MKGSGKQILLQILTELSTRITREEDLPLATRRLRAGLLLHGSTSDESYDRASVLQWASRRDPQGGLDRQGIAVGTGKVFLTELHDTVFSMPGLKEYVLREHPSLDARGFAAFEWVMWLLVSSVEMFPEFVSIENVDDLDVDEWIEVMSRHYDRHFKDKASQEPNDGSGQS